MSIVDVWQGPKCPFNAWCPLAGSFKYVWPFSGHQALKEYAFDISDQEMLSVKNVHGGKMNRRRLFLKTDRMFWIIFAATPYFPSEYGE